MVLTASAARAERLPFEIVRLLPETHQVLVYDRANNTHVLLQPGSKFDDYVVIEVGGLDMIIEKDQQRFTVYPREARFLSLSVLPRGPAQPPVIYTKGSPTTAEVFAVIAMPTRDNPRALPALTTPLLSSMLKR
jgi:hypothetical protein